jgi:hypothetical protein
MSDVQKVHVENSVSWGGSLGVAIGVWWYVWGLYGFWWGVLYGLFFPVWLGFRLAEFLLKG